MCIGCCVCILRLNVEKFCFFGNLLVCNSFFGRSKHDENIIFLKISSDLSPFYHWFFFCSDLCGW